MACKCLLVVNIYWVSSYFIGRLQLFWDLGRGISKSASNLWRSGCTPCLVMIPQRKGCSYTWNGIYLCLVLSFVFCIFHYLLQLCLMVCAISVICNTKYIRWFFKCFIYFSFKHVYCWGMAKWYFCVPVSNKMACKCCYIWWVFHLIPGFENLSWHHMCVNFGNMSLVVGPLCTCLMSTWFNLVGLRHSHTNLFGLGTCTKLLHQSGVSSIPRGTTICCCNSQSNSSFNGLCNVYAMPLKGTSYGLAQLWLAVRMLI